LGYLSWKASSPQLLTLVCFSQQRIEIVDDASWIMGFLDIIDPALDRIKSLLKLDQNSQQIQQDSLRTITGANENNIDEESAGPSSKRNDMESESGFDVDAFVTEKLSLDPSKLEVQMETSRPFVLNRTRAKVL